MSAGAFGAGGDATSNTGLPGNGGGSSGNYAAGGIGVSASFSVNGHGGFGGGGFGSGGAGAKGGSDGVRGNHGLVRIAY